ncbi:MAG: hypothetical protein R2699_18035 [Acidimicrobiales bacterium]
MRSRSRPTFVDAGCSEAILLRDLGEVDAALTDLDAVPPTASRHSCSRWSTAWRADLEAMDQTGSTLGALRDGAAARLAVVHLEAPHRALLDGVEHGGASRWR